MSEGRLISLAELQEMFRDDASGVRVTHGAVQTWGRLHGLPELAFAEPAIREVNKFVRIVGPLLPLAVIDEAVTVERLDEDGAVTESLQYIVRDREPDLGTDFADLFLSEAPE